MISNKLGQSVLPLHNLCYRTFDTVRTSVDWAGRLDGTPGDKSTGSCNNTPPHMISGEKGWGSC